MPEVLLDSDILIEHLRGNEPSHQYLKRFEAGEMQRYLSIITVAELAAGQMRQAQEEESHTLVLIGRDTPAGCVPQDRHKLLGGDNDYFPIRLECEEVIISGDEIVGARFDGAGQHHIILGVAAHTAEAGKIDDEVDGSPKRLKKFHDILIGVAMASPDALVLQKHARGLIEDLLCHVEVKNSRARMLEEFG